VIVILYNIILSSRATVVQIGWRRDIGTLYHAHLCFSGGKGEGFASSSPGGRRTLSRVPLFNVQSPTAGEGVLLAVAFIGRAWFTPLCPPPPAVKSLDDYTQYIDIYNIRFRVARFNLTPPYIYCVCSVLARCRINASPPDRPTALFTNNNNNNNNMYVCTRDIVLCAFLRFRIRLLLCVRINYCFNNDCDLRNNNTTYIL